MSAGTGVIHFNGGGNWHDVCGTLMLLGFGLGIASRLGVLISASALLVVPSVAISIACGLSVLDAALAAMAMQTIVQSCYFGGSLVRSLGGSFAERN